MSASQTRGNVFSGRLAGFVCSHTWPVEFNTSGIGTGVLLDVINASTTNPVQIEVSCQIVTAFNAATSNVLTVGTSAGGTQWLGSSDITEGTPGYYPASNAVTKFRLTAATNIYATYNGAFATSTLTSTNTIPANNSTVTIGTKVYTFKTTLGTTDGNVLAVTDADTSLLNLIRAINFSGTPGTDYVGSAANTQVTAATSVTTHAFVITARASGTGGNAIATTSSTSPDSHATWTSTVMAGGTSPTTGSARVFVREFWENTKAIG